VQTTLARGLFVSALLATGHLALLTFATPLAVAQSSGGGTGSTGGTSTGGSSTQAPSAPGSGAAPAAPGAPGQPPGAPGQPPTAPIGPVPGPIGVPPTPPGAPPGQPGQPGAPVFVPPVPPNPSQSHAPGPFVSGLPLTPVAAFEFHPTLLLREEYSDNFFLERHGVENFRTVIGPGFTLLANTPKTQGSVNGRMDFTIDTAEGARRQNFFPNMTASVLHTPQPLLRLALTDSLSSGDDASQSDRTGLRAAERRAYYSNSLSLSADWTIDLVAARAYYANSYTIGSSTSGRSQNLNDSQLTHTLGVGASAPIGASNTVRAGYELSLAQGTTDSTGHLFTASFSRQLSTYAQAGVSTSYQIQSHDNSTIWNVSLFTAYGLPGGLSISASLGYSRFTSDSGQDSGGISTSTTISYLFGRVLASVSAFQDYRQTFTQGEDVGVMLTRTFTGAVSAPITSATNGNITVSYSENEPTGSGNNRNDPTTTSLTGQASISSRYFTAGVRATRGENQLIGPINNPTGHAHREITYGAFVNVPITTWLSFMLDYNYIKRNDVDTSGDVKENRISGALQASF